MTTNISLHIDTIQPTHEISGYEKYHLYHATVVNSAFYGEMPRYLLTREMLEKGTQINASIEAELLDVDGIMGSEYHEIPLNIYRPARFLAKSFTVVAEVLPLQRPDYFRNYSDYRLFTAERKCHGGYPGDLASIFSKIAYNRGENIPVSEIAPVKRQLHYDVEFNEERPQYYAHSQEAYQKRIWDALKIACG